MAQPLLKPPRLLFLFQGYMQDLWEDGEPIRQFLGKFASGPSLVMANQTWMGCKMGTRDQGPVVWVSWAAVIVLQQDLLSRTRLAEGQHATNIQPFPCARTNPLQLNFWEMSCKSYPEQFGSALLGFCSPFFPWPPSPLLRGVGMWCQPLQVCKLATPSGRDLRAPSRYCQG